MAVLRISILSLLLLASAIVTFAQSEQTSKPAVPVEPTITISILAKGVRFTALGNIGQTRLEVFSPSGFTVYNSDFKSGNVQDWVLQDNFGQSLPDGTYQCVVTTRALSGRLSTKQGTVLIQNGQASLKLGESEPVGTVEAEKALAPVTDGNAPALTLLTHDGQQGRVVSGRGGLGFATGDFFTGKDQEQMRLTAKGSLGIGVENPQAKLDVAGAIRTSEGIVFPDGSVQTTAYVASGRSLSEHARLQRDAQGRTVAATDESGSLMKTLVPQTPNAITATVNSLAKFTSVGGAQGDSTVFEVGGNVGIGTNNPQGQLHIFGSATNDVFAGLGPELVAGPAFNFGYAGSSFGRGAGFFNVRPDASAAAPNPSLRFLTANQQRMIITNTGNVGIGTTSPQSKLDVAGDLNITGNAVVAGNIAAKYQDVAEWVPARQPLAAGTVVSLDTKRNNAVAASARAYDTHIAGVVSAQPGVILGEGGAGKVLVATTGRVKVKVDASRHPIKIGDLLVTSGKPGVAKKSQPIRVAGALIHRPGTIIGKALEPLAKGQSEILVLLSLQ